MTLLAIVYGFVIPALVAAAVLLIWQWLVAGDWGKRTGNALALVSGFLAGYALLNLGEWLPNFYWHWLPYVVAMSIVPALITTLGRWGRIVGAFLTLATIGVAIWLLLPTWSKLDELRIVYYVAWTAATFGIAMLLDPLLRRPHAEKLGAPLLMTILTAAYIFAAVVIFLSGRASFTQFAGAGMAAMGGILLIHAVRKHKEELRDLAVPQTLLLTCLLLISQVDSHSDVPLASYVLVPLAPLALWLIAIKPVSRLTGWKKWLALLPLPMAILLAATMLAAIMEFSD